MDQVTKGKTVVTIYIDFSKAFDVVRHRYKRFENYENFVIFMKIFCLYILTPFQ